MQNTSVVKTVNGSKKDKHVPDKHHSTNSVLMSTMHQTLTTDYEVTCNLNTVLIARIHLAQFTQFFLGDYRDITPVASILPLL